MTLCPDFDSILWATAAMTTKANAATTGQKMEGTLRFKDQGGMFQAPPRVIENSHERNTKPT